MTPRTAAVLYFTALLFIINPLLDMALNVWPWAPSVPAWRFGAIGGAANYLISFVFGLVLAFVTAAVFAHRRTARVIAVFAALSALLMLAACLELVLDTLQLRSMVNPEAAQGFRLGVGKSLMKIVLGAMAAFLTALAAWQVGGAKGGERPAPRMLVQRKEG